MPEMRKERPNRLETESLCSSDDFERDPTGLNQSVPRLKIVTEESKTDESKVILENNQIYLD